MKKKIVKEKLYEIRKAIIEEIEEPDETPREFLRKHQDGSIYYGFQIGLTRAAMIMLDKIYEMFPEEEEKDS